MRFSTLVLICMAYSPMTHAQTIHRCEGESGEVSYSDTPCTAGTSQVKTIELEATPTAAPPAENGPAYKEEERAFQERRTERLKREQEEEVLAARQRQQEKILPEADKESDRYGTADPYIRRLPGTSGSRPIRPARASPHR